MIDLNDMSAALESNMIEFCEYWANACQPDNRGVTHFREDPEEVIRFAHSVLRKQGFDIPTTGILATQES